jgi:hypothetical protein
MEFLVVKEAVREVFLSSHRFFAVIISPQISCTQILLIFIGCYTILVIDSAVIQNTLKILYSQFNVIQNERSEICMKNQ